VAAGVRVCLVKQRIFSAKLSFVRFAKRMNTSPLRFKKVNPRNFARVTRSTLLFFGFTFNFNTSTSSALLNQHLPRSDIKNRGFHLGLMSKV
jgi:hypothetical protein